MSYKNKEKIYCALLVFLFIFFNNNQVFAQSYVPPLCSLNLLGTNTTKSQTLISTYISMFGGVSVAIGLSLAGIRMILCSRKTEGREEAMRAVGKVIIGSIIIGSACLLSGFLINITNQAGTILDNGSISDITTSLEKEVEEKDAGFIVRGIAEVISCLAETIFSWLGKVAGFLPLNELLFNDKAPFGLQGEFLIPPFTSAEWNNLNHIYLGICSISAPLVLIMVAKTGFALIFSTTSVAKRSQLQEDILRWIFSGFIIATAPILVKGLFLFCNYMTSSLGEMFKAKLPKNSFAFDYSLLAKIKTGNVLTTAIVKFLYAWKYVEINLIFLSRKVVLVVMYAFTPIAALLWGINNRVEASQIWFGEMITNATMQFFFAFTFSVMVLSLGTATWSSWLYSLIWMFALIKITDVLRNSLQGFFTRLAGIDEKTIGKSALGSVGGMVAGASLAFGQSLNNKNGKGLNVSDIKGSVFGDMFKGSKNTGFGNAPNGASNIDGATSGTSGTSSTGATANTNLGGNSGEDSVPFDENYTDDSSDFTQDFYASTQPKETEGNVFGPSGNVINDDGSVNLDNLKDKSNRQFAYDSILADNLKKYTSNSKGSGIGRTLGSVMKASTGYDHTFDGFAQGLENGISGFSNRQATQKAIDDTVQQIQQMGGISSYKINEDGEKIPIYNLNKEDILKDMFGGKDSTQTSYNVHSFKTAVGKGDFNKATQILSNAHTFNSDLNNSQRNVVIAKTNPYTSADGFRW